MVFLPHSSVSEAQHQGLRAEDCSSRSRGPAERRFRQRSAKCLIARTDPLPKHKRREVKDQVFLSPLRTASAVIGMCRTRTPTAL
jgi:hypothetical protein